MRVWINYLYGSGTDLVGLQSCSPVISLPEILRTSLGSTMQSIIAPYKPLSTSYLRSLATLRVFFTFGCPNRPLFFLTFLTTQPFWAGLICVLAFLKKKLLSGLLYRIPQNKLHFTDSTFHAASAGLFRIDFCRVVVEISIGVFFAVCAKQFSTSSTSTYCTSVHIQRRGASKPFYTEKNHRFFSRPP